jgi:hypothetical protein
LSKIFFPMIIYTVLFFYTKGYSIWSGIIIKKNLKRHTDLKKKIINNKVINYKFFTCNFSTLIATKSPRHLFRIHRTLHLNYNNHLIYCLLHNLKSITFNFPFFITPTFMLLFCIILQNKWKF